MFKKFTSSIMERSTQVNGEFGLVDDLTITYDGNRLLKVTDAAEALNYNGALDFNDGDDSTCEYDYAHRDGSGEHFFKEEF